MARQDELRRFSLSPVHKSSAFTCMPWPVVLQPPWRHHASSVGRVGAPFGAEALLFTWWAEGVFRHMG